MWRSLLPRPLRCGLFPLGAQCDAPPDPPSIATSIPCRSVSRWCLRAGQHCRLPACDDATQYHTAHHNAHATAELCRPWPLGSTSLGPPAVPDYRRPRVLSLDETKQALTISFWTTDRLVAKPPTVSADSVSPPGSADTTRSCVRADTGADASLPFSGGLSTDPGADRTTLCEGTFLVRFRNVLE